MQSPQAGSTAAVGNGIEGLWQSNLGTAIIAPDGKYIIQYSVGFLGGTMTWANNNWQFSNDSEYLFISSDSLTGSGTYVPNTSLTGSYRRASATSDTSLNFTTYANGNALAATQASVTGTWASTGVLSVTIDNYGNLTGTTTSNVTYGACNLSGSVTQYSPNTSKNLYAVSLNASNAAGSGQIACKITTSSQSLNGMGVITYSPSDGKQQLVILTRIPGALYLSTYPVKQ